MKKSQYAEASGSKLDYDYCADTKDHHRCLWNDHGDRCQAAAVHLTKVLATTTKQLPGGPHSCVIKGGYCAEHWRKAESIEGPAVPARSGKDWRDVLMDAELRTRGVI